MSVLDSIDTTVTIEWQDARTIGTLIELGGRLAIVTALRTPEEGAPIHIVVDGDVPDETVAIDGLCRSVAETPWGEQQAEVELLRVGTTCSASKLRAFIEEYGIIRGGSVHIGRNRDNPNRKRFVYHLPELDEVVRGDKQSERRRRSTKTGLTRTPPERGPRETVVPPSGPVRRRLAVSFAVDAELASPSAGYHGPRPTISGPPRSHPEFARHMLSAGSQAGAAAFAGFEDEEPADTHPDFDINALAMAEDREAVGVDLGFEGSGLRTNPDVAESGDLSGLSEMDRALRDALNAVEKPRVPEPALAPDDFDEPLPDFQGDEDDRYDPANAGATIEVGGAVLNEDLDATRLMDAIPERAAPKESIKATAHYGQFNFGPAETYAADDLDDLPDVGDLDDPEEIEDIGSLRFMTPERASTDSETVDEEMIAKIDDAIALERAFADSELSDPDEPIIVNTVSPSIPYADPVQLGHDNAAPAIAPNAATAAATARSMSRRVGTASQAAVITDSIKLPGAPAAAAARTPADLQLGSVSHRHASDALIKVQSVFGVDMAIRCDLPVSFGSGRSKRQGHLLRLAESRLRISSEHQPGLYERIDVLIPAPDGGKGKITLRCEVTRIREPDSDTAPIAFDMRLAGSNTPKQMQALRELIRSFEAPAA